MLSSSSLSLCWLACPSRGVRSEAASVMNGWATGKTCNALRSASLRAVLSGSSGGCQKRAVTELS
eukprot:10949952-Karenia_brevis.AAC.1